MHCNAHLFRLAECLRLQIVLLCPHVSIAVALPLLIHVQQRQMVTLGTKELLVCGVSCLLPR